MTSMLANMVLTGDTWKMKTCRYVLTLEIYSSVV